MRSIFDEVKDAPPEKRKFVLENLLQRKARMMHVPLACYLELTPECNFACKMCYSRLSKKQINRFGTILSADEWIDIVRQAIELGAYHIPITGGECLLHPEFKKIYREVYSMGAQIIIFSNGSLIDDEMIDFFTKYPPYGFSMTIYGFSYETYANTCGNGDAFQKVINAIEMIKKTKLSLLLKTTVTNDMLVDLPKIFEYAKRMDIRLIWSSIISQNREAKGRQIEKCALTCEQNDRIIEMISEIKESDALAPLRQIPKDYSVQEKGMLCGAGRSMMAINWKGEVQPCLTADMLSIPIRHKQRTLCEAWKLINDWAENVPQLVECQKCEYANRCQICVVSHYSDTHEFGKPSPRLCYKVQHGIKY